MSRSPIWSAIAVTLTSDIRSGHYRQGDKLPTEAALAARCGGNRHTVRHALASLAEAGLVHARRGSGVFVTARPTEYRLLYHLVQNAGWVVTHDQLLVKVWGYEYRDEPHYVRLYINYLRQKLEKDPANPKYILTERGVGYRFVDYKRQKAESK